MGKGFIFQYLENLLFFWCNTMISSSQHVRPACCCPSAWCCRSHQCCSQPWCCQPSWSHPSLSCSQHFCKLKVDEDVKDDNDETNDAVTYDGDDVDDSSECAIELSLKQIEHFVKALNLHSYPLYPTKMWSKQQQLQKIYQELGVMGQFDTADNLTPRTI